MEQPNFYAIIPAIVRYDKQLKANEKLLYGEITSLANAKGYCYANNNYFAQLYDVSIDTVSRWIAHLERLGFINTVVLKKEGNKRKIYICEVIVKDKDLPTKKSIPTDEKVDTPIDKKVEHNNTSINNIKNIFGFWNSKGIINHKKLSSDFEKVIDTAIKKYGVENIMLAIERYSQAYFDTNFYYKHRWNLLNFLKQGNGISNWLDDGQIWNNYSPATKVPTHARTAVPDSQQTNDYLANIKKLHEGGVKIE